MALGVIVPPAPLSEALLVGLTIYCMILSMTIHLHLASFYATQYFEKKLGEMLTEQIIEFELRA